MVLLEPRWGWHTARLHVVAVAQVQARHIQPHFSAGRTLGHPPQLPASPLTRAADRGLDPRLLQHRDAVDGTFNVWAEHVPVQVEEAKGKLV